jgi:hypothetical protein
MSRTRFNLLRMSAAGLTVIIGGVLMVGAATTPALAYLDGGAGSMLVQGILATGAGTVFALKHYWHRIVSLFARNTPADEVEDTRR